MSVTEVYPHSFTNAASQDEAAPVSREGSYVHFFPAVRLGDALASREDYRDKSWAEVEPEAQRQWEQEHERPWAEFREVARQAWEEVKAQFLHGSEALKDPNSYEAKFFNHYKTHYTEDPDHYDNYAPAYYYGYDLGVDTRLKDKSWAEVEPEARDYWNNESYAGPWEEFKEAVYYAWNEIRQPERPLSS